MHNAAAYPPAPTKTGSSVPKLPRAMEVIRIHTASISAARQRQARIVGNIVAQPHECITAEMLPACVSAAPENIIKILGSERLALQRNTPINFAIRSA